MTPDGLRVLAMEAAGCRSWAEFSALSDDDRALWLGRAWTLRGSLSRDAHPPPPRE